METVFHGLSWSFIKTSNLELLLSNQKSHISYHSYCLWSVWALPLSFLSQFLPSFSLPSTHYPSVHKYLLYPTYKLSTALVPRTQHRKIPCPHGAYGLHVFLKLCCMLPHLRWHLDRSALHRPSGAPTLPLGLLCHLAFQPCSWTICCRRLRGSIDVAPC